MLKFASRIVPLTASLLMVTSLDSAFSAEILVDKYTPDHHPLFKGLMKPFAERVEASSNGAVTIKFSGSSLAPSPRRWQAAVSGVADIEFMFTGFEAERLALIQMGQLPLLAPSARVGSIALSRTQNKFFDGADKKDFEGVKLLGVFSFSGGHIMTAKHSITSLGALDGLKLGTSAGIGDRVVKAIGAVSVPLSGAQVFEVVSKGVVDGTALPDYALRAWKIGQYLKHYTEVGGGLYSYTYAVIMNQEKWDGLSSDEKSALETASGEHIAHDAKEYDDQGDAAVKEMRDSGLEYVRASDSMLSEIRKRTLSLEDEWVAKAKERGVDGAAALDFYRSQAKALSEK